MSRRELTGAFGAPSIRSALPLAVGRHHAATPAQEQEGSQRQLAGEVTGRLLRRTIRRDRALL